MKKLLFSLLLVIGTLGLASGQTLDQFSGSMLMFSVNTPNAPVTGDYRVVGLHGDITGNYNSEDLEVGDYLFLFRGTLVGFYEVVKIHINTGGLYDIEVDDSSGLGLPQATEGFICKTTPNRGYPLTPIEGAAPNGNGNTMFGHVIDHLIMLLDQDIEVLVQKTDTDSIRVLMPDGTVLQKTRNDTIDLTNVKADILGENGLYTPDSAKVRLGGVLIEQTFVNSYNPDSSRGYTMQFDYFAGSLKNFFRIDSTGEVRIQTTDTTGVDSRAEGIFQEHGEKLTLRQISEDRSRLYQNILDFEDRNVLLENKDSTSRNRVQLYLRDGIRGALRAQHGDSTYYEVFVSSDGGIHRGIYLKDSAAINSQVIPGAVWTAVNNSGGGKWSDLDLANAARDSLFIGINDTTYFIPRNNGTNDTLNFNGFIAELLDPDGNGIYGGPGLLSQNTLVNGQAYNFLVSTTGNIVLGDFLGAGQKLTMDNDIGFTNFVGVDSFQVNGIEYPVINADQTGKEPGDYFWSVDENGENGGWEKVAGDNGFFSAENQLGTIQVDTALFEDNIVFRRIDTLGFDFSTNNVIEVDNLGKFLGPSNYEVGYRARSRTIDGSYSLLEMYAENRNIGKPEGLLHYSSDVGGAAFEIQNSIGPINISSNPDHDINLLHPFNARINISDSSVVYNAGAATTTGLLGIDPAGNIEEYRAQGRAGQVLSSNGTTWEPTTLGALGSNGLFSLDNQGGTALVDSFNLSDSLTMNFVNDNEYSFVRFVGSGTTGPYPAKQTIKRGIEVLGYVPGGGAGQLQIYAEPGSGAESGNQSVIWHKGNPFNGSKGALTVRSSGQLNLAGGDGNVSVSGRGFQVIGMVDDNISLSHPVGTGRIQFGPNFHIDDATGATAYSLLALNSTGQMEEYVAESNNGAIPYVKNDRWNLLNLDSTLAAVGATVSDSLFLQVDGDTAQYVNQHDSENDTLNIDIFTKMQYVESYVTGGSNGDVDSETGPELLNSTTSGTVNTIIGTGQYTVYSDGRIGYNAKETIQNVDVDISCEITGGGNIAYFYLAKNGVHIPNSRITVRRNNNNVVGHISYILSLEEDDVLSVVGNTNLDNAAIFINDLRMRCTKIR
jgi:hypothetical protein